MTAAAIYARFSSELQDERSLGDQIELCRQYAQRNGWRVAGVYSDAATSGASMHNRPGLAALLESARAGDFQVVLTESLDRLSRDLEDIAGLYKRLRFSGLEIVTLADGSVNKMHVGLKGLMASIFLDDLAQKTKRGHIGRLNAGKLPGGKLYGYDVVLGDPGARRINPDEAAIVRRIFSEYAAGRSPREIVRDLNAERVPAPRGGLWNASTISGSVQRQNGIIQSRLYVGEIVYNRETMVKDPATGKRIHRVNPSSAWIVHPVPHLAIVTPEIFEAVGQRRQSLSQGPLTQRRRPKHLFSGRVQCGCCGHPLIVVRPGEVGCSGRLNKAVCENRSSTQIRKIEDRVLGVIAGELLTSEMVAAAVAAYKLERERLAAKRAKVKARAAHDLAGVEAKIARIVTAIETGGDVPSLAARLAQLEADRKAIQARTADAIPDNVLAVYPNAAQRFRRQVESLAASVNRRDARGDEARELIRELVSEIVVTPAPGRPTIEVRGDLAALFPARGIDGSGTRT
ncbi:MAG: hypothetical protein B7Y80_01770 [Hyphomicrobium sp. 32-62-53]|nr:MAG: hypothetical protein B7Z29_02120 [Hyphomicrobium sp. 12-62-95]OYY01481.1 MAG: hypothetical protein B7Y80_01770 [Hyphomicrobium sp. 32-62-53]